MLEDSPAGPDRPRGVHPHPRFPAAREPDTPFLPRLIFGSFGHWIGH